MKIVLTEDAIRDLQEIYEYIAKDDAVAADRHREELIGAGKHSPINHVWDESAMTLLLDTGASPKATTLFSIR